MRRSRPQPELDARAHRRHALTRPQRAGRLGRDAVGQDQSEELWRPSSVCQTRQRRRRQEVRASLRACARLSRRVPPRARLPVSPPGSRLVGLRSAWEGLHWHAHARRTSWQAHVLMRTSCLRRTGAPRRAKMTTCGPRRRREAACRGGRKASALQCAQRHMARGAAGVQSQPDACKCVARVRRCTAGASALQP